ncbi:kelch domain-containing protein 4-like isoform X1 [Stegodyphus dumicola]|uniref:kelch domain-containing protein 4-like isoform X1 n=1 Tax=Stegodyphus dumicola TaxID=202533 RepID=UPI0015B16F72|nr:kelch domain-containing protein 4-like isoform X1 [Stegodyphus dumicola]
MGKKDKKKGKGAEKTASKTEKKALNKLKKDLAAKGEDDIEKLIAEFQARDKKLSVTAEELCSQPSPRSGFTLCAHPDKDELLLFGGEYFNGSKTMMYNDLYFYNIKKGQWSILQCPEKPPPRCGHQAVVVSQRGGQMWIFGGEFASPTRSNFYHYKDLWVFHLTEKRWEQIKVPGAPSSRSGHRMVVSRKQIVLFGGFHESIRDYKYFNDVYIFDLESYAWSKIEPGGKGPSPRSGCQMAPLTDGRILLYGGYSREKVKKDVDKGTAYTDMYYLQVDERIKPSKWKWVQVKPSGIPPSARSGFSLAVASNNHAYAFGGVHDEDVDEESMESVFHNDLFLLELEKGRWMPVKLHGKDARIIKKKRRKEKGNDDDADDEEEVIDENAIANTLEKTTIAEESSAECEVKTTEDNIFTVKIGPQNPLAVSSEGVSSSSNQIFPIEIFVPKARMNASVVIKHGILYLYGGLYEEGDRQLTLSDFYSLDIHKLDEWRTIVPFSTELLEWVESEESESSDSNSDIADDDEEDADDEEMDTS